MSIPSLYNADAEFSANGSGASMAPNGTRHSVTIYFGAGVTFGSGTLTLMTSPDGGTTWVSTGITITSATASSRYGTTYEVAGSLFRWTLTGSTTPTINIATKFEQIHYHSVQTITFADNGTSTPFMLDHDESTFAFTAYGTWDSGSLTIETSPDGGTTWFKEGAAVTANSYNTRTGVTDRLFRFVMASVADACDVQVNFIH
jgi:hypothetical protein